MSAAIERFVRRATDFFADRVPPWLVTHARRWWWRLRIGSLTNNGWIYLIVVLTAGGGAWLRDSNGLLLLAGMLAGPLLVSFWLVRRTLARLAVERRLSQWVTAGDQLMVELVVTNRRRWISVLALEIEDACRYDGPLLAVEATGSRIMLPHLAPRASCRLVYEGSPPVRGRYQFGPVRVSTVAPLGLVRHRRSIDLPAEIIAWPRLGRLTPAGMQLTRHSDLAIQRTRRRPTRMEVDFHGLRDWRPGDSRRWIHWRSTARRGQIVVRQFDMARGHDVSLFLDLLEPPGGAADTAASAKERVEIALSLAATLVWDICRLGGCRVLIVVAGQETIRVEGRASAGLARQAIARLAVAQSRATAALPAEFIEAFAAAPPACTLLLVATQPVDLAQLSLDPTQPLAQATRSRVKTLTVGTPEMAHYFTPP